MLKKYLWLGSADRARHDADGATPRERRVKIFLVAAEESGDRLGAALIDAIRNQTSDNARETVEFAGVGGRDMAAAGMPSLFPFDELSIIGFHAIIRKLPLILRRIRETVAAIVAQKPDVLVIIDSPDFTHRVARRVRKRLPCIPIVDYVSPSVWAWRPWRARSMRSYVDHVLALLPFEPEAHARLGGPRCTYVGHPLADRVTQLRPDAAEAARRANDPPVLLVLPGSRSSEIRRMLGVFGDAITLLEERHGALDVIIPTLPHLAADVTTATGHWPVRARIVADAADKLAAFRVARAALTKSGTVTLELAVAGVPMVAAYKVSAFDAFVARRLVKVSSVILANLVLGDNVVPEFLQDNCTADRLATALAPLLSDTAERTRQIAAFHRLDATMHIGAGGPAAHAARVILSEIGGRTSRGRKAPLFPA